MTIRELEKWWLAYVFVIAGILVPCGGPLLAAPRSDREKQELRIYEAIFRYQIEKRNHVGPFFLSISDGDPTDEFVARFDDMKTPVKKSSAAHFVKNPPPGYVCDRVTGERGVELSADRVIWISANRVKVKGGSFCGGRCADSGVYHLEKVGGRWTVKSYNVEFVS